MGSLTLKNDVCHFNHFDSYLMIFCMIQALTYDQNLGVKMLKTYAKLIFLVVWLARTNLENLEKP